MNNKNSTSVLLQNQSNLNIFHSTIPSTQTPKSITSSLSADEIKEKLHELELEKYINLKIGPSLVQRHQLLWINIENSDFEKEIIYFFKNNSNESIQETPISIIKELLYDSKSVDANLCTLLYLNPFERLSAPKYIYKIHVNFLFSQFKNTYFNSWYDEHFAFFEQLGLFFTFHTQDESSCTIDGQTYCTKEQIERVVIGLKDLAKHYKGRFWCTQTIDQLESIEDFAEQQHNQY